MRMARSADGARVIAAVPRAAMIVASALLLGAAGCTSTSDVLDAAPEPVAAADGSPQAPVVAPDGPRFVPPAAVPPDPAQRIHRTLPPNSRDLMPGAAAFWWGPTGYPEVAQSVLLEEGMVLESLGVALQRASTLEGWLTAPEEEIAWKHETRWSGSTGDASIRISIWAGGEEGFGELVDVSGLPQLTEQWITMPLAIQNNAAGENWLVLPEPVELPAGRHLISLGLQSFGDPVVFNTYVWGRESGDRTAGGFRADVPLPEACGRYARGEDLYPDGRIYYRRTVQPPGTRLVDLEAHATDVFAPHNAKVLGPLPEGCSESDYVDILNPGDLELQLRGAPLDADEDGEG